MLDSSFIFIYMINTHTHAHYNVLTLHKPYNILTLYKLNKLHKEYIMKKRVSIYIDGDVWDNFKEDAWKRRKSASALIEEILKSASKAPVVQMDNKKTIRQKKIEEVKDKDLTPKISKSDQDMLERAQRLAANKQVEWRGGYSKEAQLKKGKKTK